MAHPAVPLLLKALPVIALAYMIFPRDLLLDLRAFGLIDDAIIVVLLLGFFTSRAADIVARSGKAKQEAVPVDFVVLGQDAPGGETGAPGSRPPRGDIRS